MSKYEDIKQIFEERVKKETFTMLCYEENSKSSMIISSKENFNYDDVCKDLKTSDTLFIFEKNTYWQSKLDENNKDFIKEIYGR